MLKAMEEDQGAVLLAFCSVLQARLGKASMPMLIYACALDRYKAEVILFLHW